jgi:hypothetical protein
MTITDSIYYENVSLAELLDRYPDPGKVLCWDDLRRLAHDASYLLADTASETIRAEIVRHVSLVARDLRELDAAGPGVIETKLGVIPGWDFHLSDDSRQLAVHRWRLELLESPALRWRLIGALDDVMRTEVEAEAEIYRMPYKVSVDELDSYECSATGAKHSGRALVIEPRGGWVVDEMQDLPPIRISPAALEALLGSGPADPVTVTSIEESNR